MPTETFGCCFKISTACWYHGQTNNTDTDTGIPVETSFCMAMFTLWLMPMSSVRMIRETAEALRGLSVCADTTVTKLADSNQLTQVTVRIRRMDGAPLVNGSRTRYNGVTCPCRMERQDPYTGSPDQATTRAVCSPRACARCCRVWEGNEIPRRRARAA